MLVLFFIIFIALFIFALYLLKIPKFDCLCMITGGVKTGKSTLSVYLAIKKYKSQLRKWRFRKFFKFFRVKQWDKPLLYSNIELSVPYVKLTEDLLLRKKRFVYHSVIYISEASLVADSQLIRDMTVNDRLLLFNKLFGHETLGGYLIYDTQSIVDCHYSIKRCLSNYFYIHHTIKFLPFFLIMKVRELMHSEDGTQLNTYNQDVECDLCTIVVPKSVWKKFDAYTYSCLTDDLPVEDSLTINTRKSSLKTTDIVTFRPRKFGGDN